MTRKPSLYFLQTRYYDPLVKRFLNADSLFIAGDEVTGANMYAYCNGNPVMLWDPSGEEQHPGCLESRWSSISDWDAATKVMENEKYLTINDGSDRLSIAQLIGAITEMNSGVDSAFAGPILDLFNRFAQDAMDAATLAYGQVTAFIGDKGWSIPINWVEFLLYGSTKLFL